MSHLSHNPQVATLHIRNISDMLVKRLKVQAIESGISLKQLVVQILDGAEPRRAVAQPANSEICKSEAETNISSAEMPTATNLTNNESDSPVSSVREDAAIPAPERREPITSQANGTRSCVHGTPKGYNCWQCGGLAKV